MAIDDPQISLELDEGERILYIGRRHWMELVQGGIAYIVVGAIAGLLALYRAVGGTFLQGSIATTGLDVVNVLVLLMIILVLWFWRRSRVNVPQRKVWQSTLNIIYPLSVLTLLAVFAFRFSGGRLLYIDPALARPFDLFNIILIIAAVISIGMMVYLYVDWLDDFLVLTSTRVVYDDEQLFARHIQQQILIDDIQQVNLKSDTYPAYWFNYGTIVIRSFSPVTITFKFAADPRELQSRIQAELNNLRKSQGPELLRQLIEDRVYNNQPQPKASRAIHVASNPGPLPWLIKPNPEIDFKREIVIWRPAWVFLMIALIRPIGVLLLILVLVALGTNVLFLPVGWMAAVTIFALLVCGFWAFWVYEEHQNDVYILTRSDITDVDKRPFGPETRRRAPLSAVQDVSFDISYIESILGFGTVIVQTGGAAGGKFTFNHVPDPRGVQATINDYLTDFRKREKERQFQDSLSLLREYHHVQAQHGELADTDALAREVAERLSEQQAAPQAPSEQSVRAMVQEEIARVLRRPRRRSP